MIEEKTYSWRNNRKELIKILNKHGCPFCGKKNWIEYDLASGYGSHWDDSEIRCNRREETYKREGHWGDWCPFSIHVYRNEGTIEEHLKHMNRIARNLMNYHSDELKETIKKYYMLMDLIYLYTTNPNRSTDTNERSQEPS